MQQGCLNDAAIALHQVLSEYHIKYGIFGDFAITLLGGPCKSNDVGCLVSASKHQMIGLLHNNAGFQVLSGSRQDYVAFLWSDKAYHDRVVLVGMFCETFPGSIYTMSNINPGIAQITGQTRGPGETSLLDPTYLFKDRLRAAATRTDLHDPADLRWLEGRFRDRLHQNRHELSVTYVGLAMKRYPDLEACFMRIGLDVRFAKLVTNAYDLNDLPRREPGDVQRGLLAPANHESLSSDRRRQSFLARTVDTHEFGE